MSSHQRVVDATSVEEVERLVNQRLGPDCKQLVVLLRSERTRRFRRGVEFEILHPNVKEIFYNGNIHEVKTEMCYDRINQRVFGFVTVPTSSAPLWMNYVRISTDQTLAPRLYGFFKDEDQGVMKLLVPVYGDDFVCMNEFVGENLGDSLIIEVFARMFLWVWKHQLFGLTDLNLSSRSVKLRKNTNLWDFCVDLRTSRYHDAKDLEYQRGVAKDTQDTINMALDCFGDRSCCPLKGFLEKSHGKTLKEISHEALRLNEYIKLHSVQEQSFDYTKDAPNYGDTANVDHLRESLSMPSEQNHLFGQALQELPVETAQMVIPVAGTHYMETVVQQGAEGPASNLHLPPGAAAALATDPKELQVESLSTESTELEDSLSELTHQLDDTEVEGEVSAAMTREPERLETDSGVGTLEGRPTWTGTSSRDTDCDMGRANNEEGNGEGGI